MTPQVQSRGVLDKRGAHQRFTTPPQFIEPIINEILRNHHSKGRNSDIQNNNKGLHGPYNFSFCDIRIFSILVRK